MYFYFNRYIYLKNNKIYTIKENNISIILNEDLMNIKQLENNKDYNFNFKISNYSINNSVEYKLKLNIVNYPYTQINNDFVFILNNLEEQVITKHSMIIGEDKINHNETKEYNLNIKLNNKNNDTNNKEGFISIK